MKPVLLLRTLLLCGAIATYATAQTTPHAAADTTQRISVVLFDLECDDIAPEALRILTDVMRGELVKSDRFQLIDRAHVQMVLDEQQFQLGETVDDASKVEMGQIIGAEMIVTGRIGYLGKIRVITLQLIDVVTGRVERLEATDFVGEVESLRRPVRAATQRLIGIGGYLDLGGGFIHVVSRPVGATVYIDGLYEGVTPLETIVDSSGNYFIRIVKDGYQEWTRQVYVEAGETSFLEPALVSLTPSDIHMESTPPGANVYVYGRFQGVTPLAVRVDSAGMYEIEMTRDGFHDWEEVVHVRIGEDLALQAPLVPIEVIDIESSPAGATIYLDGGLVGTAPVSIPVGSPGEYSVRAVKDDYIEWVSPVMVRSGEHPTLRANMIPIAIPSPYVTTGKAALWTFMLPYSIAALEATIYSLGVESERPYIGAVLVGGPATYYMMLRFSEERDISQARASMIISSGLWGAAWGIMSGVAVRPEGGSISRSGESRGAAALGAIASAAAIAVSAHYTEDLEISSERVMLINAGGFLGTVMGVGFPYLFNAQDNRVYFASLVAGGVAGALYTVYATKSMDRRIDDSGTEEETGALDNFRFLQPYVAVDAGRSYRTGDESMRYGLKLMEYRF